MELLQYPPTITESSSSQRGQYFIPSHHDFDYNLGMDSMASMALSTQCKHDIQRSGLTITNEPNSRSSSLQRKSPRESLRTKNHSGLLVSNAPASNDLDNYLSESVEYKWGALNDTKPNGIQSRIRRIKRSFSDSEMSEASTIDSSSGHAGRIWRQQVRERNSRHIQSHCKNHVSKQNSRLERESCNTVATSEPLDEDEDMVGSDDEKELKDRPLRRKLKAEYARGVMRTSSQRRSRSLQRSRSKSRTRSPKTPQRTKSGSRTGSPRTPQRTKSGSCTGSSRTPQRTRSGSRTGSPKTPQRTGSGSRARSPKPRAASVARRNPDGSHVQSLEGSQTANSIASSGSTSRWNETLATDLQSPTLPPRPLQSPSVRARHLAHGSIHSLTTENFSRRSEKSMDDSVEDSAILSLEEFNPISPGIDKDASFHQSVEITPRAVSPSLSKEILGKVDLCLGKFRTPNTRHSMKKETISRLGSRRELMCRAGKYQSDRFLGRSTKESKEMQHTTPDAECARSTIGLRRDLLLRGGKPQSDRFLLRSSRTDSLGDIASTSRAVKQLGSSRVDLLIRAGNHQSERCLGTHHTPEETLQMPRVSSFPVNKRQAGGNRRDLLLQAGKPQSDRFLCSSKGNDFAPRLSCRNLPALERKESLSRKNSAVSRPTNSHMRRTSSRRDGLLRAGKVQSDRFLCASKSSDFAPRISVRHLNVSGHSNNMKDTPRKPLRSLKAI